MGKERLLETVKLILTWDIRPGKEAAYFNFFAEKLGPRLAKLGLDEMEAWYTVYGDAPQILTAGVANDMATMRRILTGPEWQNLSAELANLVANFHYKVVTNTGRFQL
jgi:hypothetical protein